MSPIELSLWIYVFIKFNYLEFYLLIYCNQYFIRIILLFFYKVKLSKHYSLFYDDVSFLLRLLQIKHCDNVQMLLSSYDRNYLVQWDIFIMLLHLRINSKITLIHTFKSWFVKSGCKPITLKVRPPVYLFVSLSSRLSLWFRLSLFFLLNLFNLPLLSSSFRLLLNLLD